MPNPILCYVDGSWAYFTTQSLQDQWGDDWNDAPYEHNAGHPYEPSTGTKRYNHELKTWEDYSDYHPDGTPKWQITRVAWEGPFETPADLAGGNSRYSVEKINAGAVAWLAPAWGSHTISIPAGTSLREFVHLVQAAGGKVYMEVKGDMESYSYCLYCGNTEPDHSHAEERTPMQAMRDDIESLKIATQHLAEAVTALIAALHVPAEDIREDFV